MTANVGGIDRTLRILARAVVLCLFLVLEGSNRWWVLAGFIPLVTGFVAWCPAYLRFGFSTRKSCCGA